MDLRIIGLTLALLLCMFLWHLAVENVENYEDSEESSNNDTNQNTTSDGETLVPPTVIQPTDDFKKLIDLENFEFLINQETLCGKRPLILILIHSAPDNFQKRQVIRETWGKSVNRSGLVFLLGTVESQALQNRLMTENNLNGDLVQGNFLDSYRNLSYKHVMGLKYFRFFCPDTMYVLKTDDDVFVNTPFIYQLLEDQASLRELLFCYEVVGARVKRSFRSKWRVSSREYSEKFYPSYCPGFSILYSADVVQKLYEEAQESRYFWIDDVWVTGILAQQANISISLTQNFHLDNSGRERILDGQDDTEDLQFFFTEPNLTENEIRQLWRVVADQTFKGGIRIR